MASDAITLIMNDHRLMEQLFERLKSGEGDRRVLLAETAAHLAAHSHAEEEKVYPVLAETVPAEFGDVEQAIQEHHEADVLLHRLQSMDADDPAFTVVLEKFIGTVLHHVEQEESELLPALREAVDRRTLEELGAAFAEVRAHELEVAGMGRSASGVPGRGASGAPGHSASGAPGHSASGASGHSASGASGSGGGLKPDEMSRDELYAQAKLAGIAGRSNMTKEELARALREQR
jgi:hemerythrin superfamily protein